MKNRTKEKQKTFKHQNPQNNMAVLEKIKQMQSQNLNDSQIYQNLSEQGFNPKDISDGLAQARIRNAVMSQAPAEDRYADISQIQQPIGMRQYPGSSQPSAIPNPYPQMQDASQLQDYRGYESSPDPNAPDYNPEFSVPQQMQQNYSPTQNYDYNQQAPQMSQEEYQSYNQMPQNYQTPDAYGQDVNGYPTMDQGYDQGYYQEGITLETVNDVAEQVFIEKTKKIRNDLDALNEFKMIMQNQISRMEKDLSRMQTIMDNLQMSVIQKIGSYEQGISSMKSEMEMMQDSFGKVVNQTVNRNLPNQSQSQQIQRQQFQQPTSYPQQQTQPLPQSQRQPAQPLKKSKAVTRR